MLSHQILVGSVIVDHRTLVVHAWDARDVGVVRGEHGGRVRHVTLFIDITIVNRRLSGTRHET